MGAAFSARLTADNGDRPYDEAFILIETHLVALKALASCVEVHDKMGFSRISAGSIAGRTCEHCN